MKNLGNEGPQVIRKKAPSLDVWWEGRGSLRPHGKHGELEGGTEVMGSRCRWEQGWPFCAGWVLTSLAYLPSPLSCQLTAAVVVWCGGQDGGRAGVHPAVQVVCAARSPTLRQQHLPEHTALPGPTPGAAGPSGQWHPL